MSLNYTEIKEKFPKAFEALLSKLNDTESEVAYELDEYGNFGVGDGYEYWEKFPDRDLYDFFDEEGILIHIEAEFDPEDFHSTFSSNVVRKHRAHRCIIRGFPTRKEAEETAFTKAFEILEERLNREQ